MSGSGMHCGDHHHPCAPVREHDWVVTRRNYRCSAFDGYRVMWSPYSDVKCLKCDAHWRTKAKYVDKLKDGKL